MQSYPVPFEAFAFIKVFISKINSLVLIDAKQHDRKANLFAWTCSQHSVCTEDSDEPAVLTACSNFTMVA